MNAASAGSRLRSLLDRLFPKPLLAGKRGGPWGGSNGEGGGEPPPGGGDEPAGEPAKKPRNPWSTPPAPPRGSRVGGDITSLDEFLKRSRARFGSGGGFGGLGGRFPRGSRPYWFYGLIAFVVLWMLFTSFHRIGPQEQGVVTTFGYYDRTLPPGIGFSWPAPIGRVQKVDVGQVRALPIPRGDEENLILTGDQNVIDLAYRVNWKIKDPERYLFQIADPEQTIREVAESAMRAVVARVSLNDAIGAGRGEIEQNVRQNMQQLLDDYGAGIEVRNVSINQSSPPSAVNEAFLQVSAAQQQAQSYQNDARAYATQITAKAQGDAASFDKVYTEYRAAPEVTRRRMYYETMERILAQVDTTIVETPGVTPYLPLPEIRRRQEAAPAAEAPAR